MPPIVKSILKVVAIAAVVMIAFRTNWALGAAAIALLLGYLLVMNRSAFYAQRGNVAYMKGDHDQALIMMEKAYQTKPNNPQHMVGYGYLLTKKGQLGKAEEVLDEVLHTTKARDAQMQGKMNLATVYWLQGKREEAHSVQQEVFGEYKNTMVYGNLGYFKILLGNLEEALAFNLQAYDYNDNDLTIMDNLAQNYFLLGRLEEAEAMYEKVIAKSPKHAESYYYYAKTLQKLGKTDEAKEQLKQALEKEFALVTALTREEVERAAHELSSGDETSTN